MNYLTIHETAGKWNVPESLIRGLLENGYVKDAEFDTEWRIPEEFLMPDLNHEGSSYPLLQMTNAVRDPFRLNEDELTLLLLQLDELKGKYKEIIPALEELSRKTEYAHVRNGCYATLCQAAMATGNLYVFRQNLDRLNKINSSNKYEHKEKELLVCRIYSNLYYQDTPEWMMEGDMDYLSSDAMPSARVLYIFNQIKNAETVRMSNFRILLSETKNEGADVAAVYTLLLMASAYHYMGDIDKSTEFINEALDIAMPKGWVAPLLSLRKSIGVTLDQEIKARNEYFYKDYVNMHKDFMDNWNRVYEYYKGEYPTKDLNLREEEIMFYVMNGKSNQEIADILCLSIETIKTNLKAIFQKTGVGKRNELKDYMDEHK